MKKCIEENAKAKSGNAGTWDEMPISDFLKMKALLHSRPNLFVFLIELLKMAGSNRSMFVYLEYVSIGTFLFFLSFICCLARSKVIRRC